jgi:hypothetical protein
MNETPGEHDDHARPDGGSLEKPCDDCGRTVRDALARTVRVTVDRSEVHSHRLCPDCFADWIDRYEREMQPAPTDDGDSEIIVD